MTITHLVLSLASIAVASIGLYFYFKKRIISVEKKLDLMFQLVQEHQRQAQQQAQIILSQKTNNITETTSNQNSKVLVSDDSDDESDYGSDSEEISDSESIPEVKNIILNNDNNPLSNIISLAGADATPITIKTIHLGEDNTSDFNSIDNSLDNLIEKKINNAQDTIKIEEITLDSISGDEKELEQQEEEEDEEEEEEEEEDLNKLHLPDLKEKAKNLGLSGYSNLRKVPLIQKIKDAMNNNSEIGLLD